MTAPDHFAKTELNPFAGGGRPQMNCAQHCGASQQDHEASTPGEQRVTITE